MTALRKVAYAELPIDAQMAIAHALGSIPISATPAKVFEAGKAWGVIIQNGPDAFTLTAYGDKVITEELARKDAAVRESEARARKKAGDAAGAYLDEIGKTDLATLTAQQWDTFCEKLTASFMYWRLASK